MENTQPQIEENTITQIEAGEEIELRRLFRSISLSEKYFLFFASCNQLSTQKELIKKLKSELKGKKIVVVEFKKPITSLLTELQKKIKAKKPDAVIVIGLRYSILSDKKAKESAFIANLNISRDSFPAFLDCPLILFMPEFAIGKLMNGAPDFFSARSSVFYFESDEKITAQQILQENSISAFDYDTLSPEQRLRKIEEIKILLSEYESLDKNKRDFQIEYGLKNKLADLYFQIADYSKAEKLIEVLLNETKLRKDDPKIAAQLNNLANVYRSQGRYDEAIEKYEEALQIGEKTIGKEHPDYATGLNNLANVYHSQSRYDEAIKKFEEALRIDEKTIGKEHPAYALELNNLAGVYYSQGRYDEAIKKFEEALRIDEKTIGKEHPDYAIHLNNLANVYNSQGRYEKAIVKYEEALRIFVKFLGEDHYYTKATKEHLESCREAMGKA